MVMGLRAYITEFLCLSHPHLERKAEKKSFDAPECKESPSPSGSRKHSRIFFPFCHPKLRLENGFRILAPFIFKARFPAFISSFSSLSFHFSSFLHFLDLVCLSWANLRPGNVFILSHIFFSQRDKEVLFFLFFFLSLISRERH